jgi:signal peptidase II
MKKALLTIFLVLLIDQGLKLWVKTSFTLDEEIDIFGEWFRLHFTENRGMAFGIEIGGEGSHWGKIFLSLFRVVAICFITWYLVKLVKRKAQTGLIVAISLILAGAAGNIIDSAFYGLIFSDSYFAPAAFMPTGGGYAGFLQGDVVDMLYFPLFTADLPWIGPFTFFSPIFNIADTAISVGVFILLIKQKSYFGDITSSKTTTEENKEANTSDEHITNVDTTGID